MSENHKEVSPDLSQIEAHARAKEVIARNLHSIRQVLQERKRLSQKSLTRQSVTGIFALYVSRKADLPNA